MVVRFKEFRGLFNKWESLYEEASDYATKIGRERLIGISQAVHAVPVVTVWYWGPEEPKYE